MDPLEIRPCTADDVMLAPNSAAFLADYAKESAILGMPETVADFAQYKVFEASGNFHALAAFDGDQLAGLIAFFATRIPHYGRVIASTESYYVAQEYRKRGLGLRLLHDAEAMAQSLGAVGFFVSSPSGGRLAEVLPRVGYAESNRVFFRALS